MKTIRSLMILAGLPVILVALVAVGARGQAIYSTQFVGEFTLPLATQWGTMTLPPGNYTLEYGMQESGGRSVVVRGMTKGSPHGMIQARPGSDTSATRTAIICIRDGNELSVRALELSAIGKAVTFALPHGAQLVAHHGTNSGYTQLAEAPMLFQRIPVTLSAK